MSRIIDLDGPDGNVYQLAAIARSWNNQIGTEAHKARGCLIAATTARLGGIVGGYRDVLDTFDEWFEGKISYKFVGDPRVDVDDYDDDDDD